MPLNRVSLNSFSKKPESLILGVFIFIAVLIGSFLRLWNIPETMQFLGDQGRDVLLVRRMFVEKDPVFIGPVTSVGNMYLGPLYYYFMLPFLMMSYPSPLGPAYAVALLGCLTVYLLFALGKKMIGTGAAALAMGLYAIHAIAIEFSRFSWNPNPAPFVSVLMVYWTYHAWQKNYRYWLLVVAAFCVLIQLHYIALLAAGGAAVVYLYQLWEVAHAAGKKDGLLQATNAAASVAMSAESDMHIAKDLKVVQKTTLPQLLSMIPLGLLIFFISLTPLFLFDLKHNGLNTRAFIQMFTLEQAFAADKDPFYVTIGRSLLETQGRSLHILAELHFGEERTFNTIVVLACLGTIAVVLMQRKRNPHWAGQFVLASYLFIGILGTSFYRGSLFDHYISYLFPITILIWASVLTYWQRMSRLGIFPALVIIIIFSLYNITNWPLQAAGWQIKDMKRVSESITELLEPTTPYTIILLTGTGDLHGMNYRYFLTTLGYTPLGFEAIDQAEKIIIINEDQPDFDPATSDIHEIQVFPSKKPTLRYTIDAGPEILVLDRSTNEHSIEES